MLLLTKNFQKCFFTDQRQQRSSNYKMLWKRGRHLLTHWLQSNFDILFILTKFFYMHSKFCSIVTVILFYHIWLIRFWWMCFILRLAMTESELALTEQKVNDGNMLVAKLKQELTIKVSEHQEEIRRDHTVGQSFSMQDSAWSTLSWFQVQNNLIKTGTFSSICHCYYR